MIAPGSRDESLPASLSSILRIRCRLSTSLQNGPQTLARRSLIESSYLTHREDRFLLRSSARESPLRSQSVRMTAGLPFSQAYSDALTGPPPLWTQNMSASTPSS